jgi:hypothetical protein
LPKPTIGYLPLVGGGSGQAIINNLSTRDPYSDNFSSTLTQETYKQQTEKQTNDQGEEVEVVTWQKTITEKTLNYMSFMHSGCPVPNRAILWYLKIWDRNRLVRDLIPVHAGDQIYDFIAPANGLFDKVTEIFFTNVNEGGDYKVAVTNTRGRFASW